MSSSKICLQKSPPFEKSRAKIPLVMGGPLAENAPEDDEY